MKLLFDQNLSFKLVHDLKRIFPNSVHVRKLDLDTSDDPDIWSYAKQHGFVIVTKDSDFNDRILKYGPPPKIIWVRTGNNKTAHIKKLLVKHYKHLEAFANQDLVGCYAIYDKPNQKK
jgi:predicted nuclease of predicted toxin-antitoxin system